MPWTRKRSAALLLALLMALGMVATGAPAAVAAQADSASVTASSSLGGGVMLFRGRAKIGTAGNDPCNALTDPSGLNYPLIANDNDPGTEKCYLFTAPHGFPNGNAATPWCYAVGIVNGDPVAPTGFPANNCEITASGILKAVAPFEQPHCGISASNGGQGTATVNGKAVELSDLGWITSAGSILPVIGNWDSAAKSKGERQLVALVQESGNNKAEAPPAFACFSAKGSDAFDVNGIAVLAPGSAGPVTSEPEGCEDDSDRVVDPISGEVGDESDPTTHATYEVEVHHIDNPAGLDYVEVCAEVTRGGERYRQIVRVDPNYSPEPDPPPITVDVDPDAPDGAGPGTPCTQNVFTNNNPRLHVRRSPPDSNPQTVCVGVPGDTNVWVEVEQT